MTEKILDKVVLFALIAQIGFILYMNLFRADTIIDYDSSSVYMHEMEMGSQGKLFPSEYCYQGSMDLDSAAVISAFLYHLSGNIFLSRGIANSLVVILYIFVLNYVLANTGISLRWKRFGILLFFIPYSMIMLGYWRMLFTGGGFFALRALVPILMISLIQDIEKGKAFKQYAPRAVFVLFIVFLTGLSSGVYILLCGVCPLLVWEFIRAFLKADYGCVRSKRTVLAIAAVIASVTGMIIQKALGLSSISDGMNILTSNKWIDALLASFAGIFELFGGLTIHEQVKLFSFEAIGTAVDFAVSCILITAIIYTVVSCIKKKKITDMKGYILSVMLVNAMMFTFVDLKYGENVFESRYHLVPMLPSFLLLAMMMDDISKNSKLKKVQIQTIQILAIVIFGASMLFGDAQWVYAKTALGTDQLEELNGIIEGEGINTAFIVGNDNKVLGRKLRVYSRDTHYIVLSDGAESAWQTYFGGTTRYLDNSMQTGRTAVIASPEAYETLPPYLIRDMQYLRDYDGLQIYDADQSSFDCVGGIVAERDRVIDFPYSPDYTYDNAVLDDEGILVMKAGGGSLNNSCESAEGTWNYTVYYDLPDAGGDVSLEIKVGNDEPVCYKPDTPGSPVVTDDIVMSGGKTVSFIVSATEGIGIRKIEINRR